MPISRQPPRPSEPERTTNPDVQRIQASLENLSSDIVAALSGVTQAIKELSLQAKEIKRIMLDPQKLGTLFDLVTQLIQTHGNDQSKVQALQDQLDTLTTQDAALNDPALETKMESLIDAATNAVPPGSASSSTPAGGTPATGTGTPQQPGQAPVAPGTQIS